MPAAHSRIMSSRTDAAPARILVLVMLVVAVSLRFVGLGSGLWYDEINTLVESVRLPFREIVTAFPGVNAHPLYSVFAHASIAAFGDSAWSLRLPASVFGVASVWMVYVLGARVIGRVEAWAGAALLAVSYHHIWFSQNARGYTMMGFFTLLSTYLLIRAAESERSRDYVFYAIACALGVYTHLTMVFVVAGQAVVLIGGRTIGWRPALAQPWRPAVLAWIVAATATALAYVPFVPGLVRHFGTEPPIVATKVATGGWAMTEALRSILSGAGLPAAIAGGLVALAGAVSLWRRDPLVVALLVMPAIVTVAAMAVLGQPIRPRFFFFMTGAAAIFAGRGIGLVAGWIAHRTRPGRERTEAARGGAPLWAMLACTLLLTTVSAAALPRNYTVPKQDFDGAVRFLEGEQAAGVKVAAAGPACYPIDAYFGKADWPCLETLPQLREFVGTSDRALLVYTLADYIEDADFGQYLRTSCVETRRFPGTLGGGDMVVCDPRRKEAR